MKITKEFIERISDLACLSLSVKEIETFQDDFTDILHFFEQIQDIDLKKINSSLQLDDLDRTTRPDNVIEFKNPRKLLENSKYSKQDNHIRIPRLF